MKVNLDKFDGENFLEITLGEDDMSLLDEGRLLSHNMKIGTKLFNIGVRFASVDEFNNLEFGEDDYAT